MRRHEAVVLLALGVVALVAGVTWLTGGWGLAVCGVGLVLSGLFIDVSDDEPKGKSRRGEGGT